MKCEECGKHEAHVLLKHLREAHKMTALDYSEEHHGAPVCSALGLELLRRKSEDASSLLAPEREYEEMPIGKLMDWADEDSMKVRRYLEPSPWVPTGDDEGYHYDYDATVAVAYAMHRETRNSVWICGYSGTGKTQLVLNLCRRLNRECIRVNMDSSKSPAQIVGDWVLRGNETRFHYGPLPLAMKRGAVLLLDEFDLGNPYVIPLFRPVLEVNPRLMIEDTNEVIEPEPGFCIVATANTFGAGDETGLYGNTHALSLADRQRFSLFVQMDYLAPAVELKILCDAVPDLDEDEAEKMIQVAGRIREQYKDKRIEESISPRQLVNWAEVFSESGNALTSANMAFLLPLSQGSQMSIRQIIAESGLPGGQS